MGHIGFGLHIGSSNARLYKSGVDTSKRLTALAKAADKRGGGSGRADDLDAQNRLSEADFKRMSFLPTTLAGRRGVLIPSSQGTMVLDDDSTTGVTFVGNRGRGGRTLMTSIGRKGYSILDYTAKGSGATIIIKTFKPS